MAGAWLVNGQEGMAEPIDFLGSAVDWMVVDYGYVREGFVIGQHLLHAFGKLGEVNTQNAVSQSLWGTDKPALGTTLKHPRLAKSIQAWAKSEGEALAKSWGCPFYEASALEKINEKEVFFAVVREIKKNQASETNGADQGGKKKRGFCTLL